MNHETTPDRIAHGRAMLDTIEAHINDYHSAIGYIESLSSVHQLREMYDDIERAHSRGLITDPHPRQVGTRILPRWEWWLHLVAVRLGLGGAEE